MSRSSTERRARGARASAGFSLLEVLAAFVIVSLVATALFRLYSASLNNASAAEDYSRAMLVAQSQLDAASTMPLRERSERGTDASGRVQWQSSVTTYVPPDADPDLERATESFVTKLYRINVDVKFVGADGRERTFTLATVRIGQRNPG